MKTNKRFFLTTVVLLAAYVLSACGGAPQQVDQSSGEQAAIKVRASEIAYTGVVEAINGNDWTVNGQLLTIAPTVIQDGPFQVGDTIKIEGEVATDGSITVLRVEAPSAADLTDLPPLGDDNANGNANDDNANDDNANDNSNDDDDNANDNSNDNEDDDDSNSNDNSNDDDDDDDSNSNDNSNDDDDDDDDSNSNDNSNDDDDSDDDDDDDNSND